MRVKLFPNFTCHHLITHTNHTFFWLFWLFSTEKAHFIIGCHRQPNNGQVKIHHLSVTQLRYIIFSLEIPKLSTREGKKFSPTCCLLSFALFSSEAIRDLASALSGASANASLTS